MKLSPLVLGTLTSVHGLSPGWNNFINSAQRTWFNIFSDVMGEGEHPSVLCVDEDAEITMESCKEIAGPLYSSLCTGLCYDNIDQCVGSAKISTTMKSCRRRICNPNIPVLFKGKCTKACLKVYELKNKGKIHKNNTKVDRNGPYCGSDGNQYKTLQDLYIQSCNTDSNIEVDTTCGAFYQKMVNHHQAQLDFWQNKLESTLVSTPPLLEIEKVVVIDTGKVEVECPTCAKGYNPVCAKDENENMKTFITENCMMADACNQNKTWVMVSSGVCDGDEDFMADSIVKPMIDDDFEIPIAGESELSVVSEQDSPVCPGCSKTFEPICASNGSGEMKSFNSEECMNSTNCQTNSDWSKASDGPCEGDEDFMNDLLSKPMTDDFEIPISS